MSQWLKLIQCKYTPSQLFTIYDYTKVVYAIDGGLYLKQIVTPLQKSSFISIKHDFDKMYSIHGALNNIITVEQKSENYFIYFYSANTQQQKIKLSISAQLLGQTLQPTASLSNTQLKIKSIFNQQVLMISITAADDHTNEIFFIGCTDKKIIGRGFVEGQILDIAKGPNNSLSLLINKNIIAFKSQPTIDSNIVGRIYKEAQAHINNIQIQHHFWIQDQLFVWGKNKGYIIIKNKVCQQFSNFHRLHYAAPMICGFLACDGCVIKIYKKKSTQYQLICQIIDENLMECQNLSLSPQQDILAYFTKSSKALIICSTFNNLIEQSNLRENSLEMAISIKSQQIRHHKSYDYTIYSSCQSWFAAVNGSQIKLLNSSNYQQFLSIQLANEEESKDYSNSDLKPRHLTIHPNRAIFAVALKKMIRLYYVTFNQIKLIKQINVSMVGFLLFNKSGSLLTAVVAGKNGAKLYIYRVNQIIGDYSLLQAITIGKKPIAVEWDSLDSTLYCFHNLGYFAWGLASKFKDRKQISLDFKCQIKGAILSKQDNPIFWGGSKLFLIQNQTILQKQQVNGDKIQQMHVQGQYYYIIYQNGKVGRTKTIDLQASYSKAFDLNTKSRKFQVRMQETNKIIYISDDLNIKFYQYGATAAVFSDVIGVEKRKLYQIMNKHKQYENKIKSMRQEFSSIVVELKANAAYEQQKIQNQYKFELKDHVQRQRKVKQQKAKLQQMMQKNMQIKQKQSMHQVKQLQRLYERKIALTTNKLLTQKQIGFRDKIVGENKLRKLQQLHSEGIQKVRMEFSQHLKQQFFDKSQAQRQINNIKKHYQIRLYQLEQQNQILLKGLQQKNQGSILSLKKLVNNWENKYSQCISQKDNVEKQYDQQIIISEQLKQKISHLEIRKSESERRCQNLSNEIIKMEGVLQQRNKVLQFYEKRIQDLQKSNQILKYRVLQVKQQNDPYEIEVIKLKQNLTDLQQEYEKLVKSSYEIQQKIQIVKKQKIKLKQEYEHTNQKYLKLSKRHEQLLDKVRQTTKSPIQQIRKELLNIVDSYVKINKSYSNIQKRSDSPLGELNRIRDHLEVCLDEAMTTNKKNQDQRRIQLTKKNRQNSQLIIQINTMRKKIRQLEQQMKEKNLKISRLMRGETPNIVSSVGNAQKSDKNEKLQPTQAFSKQFTKTRSRQTFYEKNMFKTGSHWNQKRLKTEEGGSRRKKSSLSMMKSNHQNSLAIHSQSQQVQEYKRIIQQKDIFIQKLIAKIQKN